MELTKRNEKIIKMVFVISSFIVVCIWACVQPYDRVPDEGMKMDICKYIAENNKLPHGGDEAVRNSIWGISYGFTPIFAYIISALFMKIAMAFTSNELIILVAARLVSVLCYTATIVMIMKIAEKLFTGIYKWVFIILVSCLPQFVFLGTYINNDSLGILSTAIITYSWITGLETKWNIKSCIILAVGLGLCALSYYNAYGFILVSIIIYFVSNFIEQGKKINIKEFIKKGSIIFVIAFLIAGWWFIRSAIIYDGDFLGLRITDEYAEKYAMEGYKPSQRIIPSKTNTSIPYMLVKHGWIKTTYMSFIGVFGNMDILLNPQIYLFCTLVLAIGGIGYLVNMAQILRQSKNKEKYHRINFSICLILCIIIPIILSIYYSYCSDFQPQGRYIMPMLIPLMYFATVGIKILAEKLLNKNSITKKIKNMGLVLLCIGWYVLPIISLVDVIIPYYMQ